MEGEELVQMLEGSISSNGAEFCSNLNTLNFLDHIIKRINKNLFVGIPTLCGINLESNNIKSIDNDTFSSLVQLKVINLSKNDIRIIQTELFQNNNRLIEVDVSFNRIAVIGKNAFKYLANLKYLYLRGNPLQQWDGDIFNNNKKT